MIVVAYYADGMKSVVKEDITYSEFWALFRRLREECNKDDPEQTYVYRVGGNRFELIDERRASGCTQYVARPDDWLTYNGEPL